MKNCLALIGLTCIFSNAFANTNPQPTFYLDQSKDIFFDQFASYSYSLQVLQAKSSFNNHSLIMGGSLQTDAQHWHGDSIITTPPSNYQSDAGFYFTQGTIDFMLNLTQWVTPFLSIANAHMFRPGPDGNDYFFNHAMFVLGNVDKFPIFVTVGINSIPFGVFAGSGIWDTPLTGSYFLPSQAPQISLVFYKDGLNVSATKFSDETNHVNHNTFSFYFNKTNGNFNYSLGAGYLTNLESNATGIPPVHRVKRRNIPAGLSLGNIIDFNASVGYKLVTLNGEYDRGTANVLSNTNSPEAWSLALNYTPTLWDQVTTFGISYSRSMHLSEVPASLPGFDAIPLAADGLKNEWGMSVSRNLFTKWFNAGFDVEKVETYTNRTSYAETLELSFYL